MVFINLIGPLKKPVRRFGARYWVLGVAALVVVGLLLVFFGGSKPAPRTLSIEERESVISLFDAVDGKVPQLHEWISEFRETFSADRLTSTVDPRLGPGSLIRMEEKAIFFSPAFFTADSVTQERWLLQLVVDANAPLEWDADEVAMRGTDSTKDR